MTGAGRISKTFSVIRFSGARWYHILVNNWSDQKSLVNHFGRWHSTIGLSAAWLTIRPKYLVRYADGTVNHWAKLERPGVFIENGHVTAVTFRVIDVEKENTGETR